MQKKIMFQGDSITDAFRDRSDNHFLSGYSLIVKNILGDDYIYVNYGISGNTSAQLAKRHEDEFKKEMPDYLILLIGINDIWRFYDGYNEFAVEKDDYVNNVLHIINISKALNPYCKIILLEPYLLPGCSNLKNVGEGKYYEYMLSLRRNCQKIVDCYIELNEEMNNDYFQGKIYSDDGVHPNDLGKKYLAEKICEYFRN